MKSTLWVLALAISFNLVGCVNRKGQEIGKETQAIVQDQSKLVQTAVVSRRPLEVTTEITGELVTSDDSYLSAKSPGRIDAVLVRDGDRVTAGQVVAKMDTTIQNSNVSAALATLSSAQSQLSQALANARSGPQRSLAGVRQAVAALDSARAQYKRAVAGARTQERAQTEWNVRSAKKNMDTAKAELDRVTNLFAEGAVSQQRLEQTQNQYAAAQAQYNSALQSLSLVKEGTRPEDLEIARMGVKQAEEALRNAKATQALDTTFNDQVNTARASVQAAQAQVKIAQQALDDTLIRAPFSGVVAGKPTQAGTVIGSGTPVLRLVGNSGLYFEGQVPEEVISMIEPGSQVAITVQALPGRNFVGVVQGINPVGNSAGRIFTARIQMNTTEGVKPGMFARGIATLRRIPDTIAVPREAVIQKDGKAYVFLAENGKAKRVDVKIGLIQDQWMQVDGIQPGQKLIVAGQNLLLDGMTVKENSTKPASATQPTTEQAKA